MENSKNLVIGIDIGTTNVGMCMWDVQNKKKTYFPDLLHTTMMITQDGRIYGKYKESDAPELVVTFVSEMWRYFKDARLVVLEQQWSRDSGRGKTNQRQCLIVEKCMNVALRVRGIKVISLNSMVWKKAIGISVGKHVSDSHRENKERAIKRFEVLCGTKRLSEIVSKNPRKFDDMIDAYLMTRVVVEDLANFEKKAVTSNHSHEIGKSRVMTSTRYVDSFKVESYEKFFAKRKKILNIEEKVHHLREFKIGKKRKNAKVYTSKSKSRSNNSKFKKKSFGS